jgi:hypothetical protein
MANQTRSDEGQSGSGRDSEVLAHPEHWKTGDEPVTTAQRAYLETLSREANEPFDPEEPLTKAEAARRIDELQRKTGRGGGHAGGGGLASARAGQDPAKGSSHYQDRPTDDGKFGDGDQEPNDATPRAPSS